LSKLRIDKVKVTSRRDRKRRYLLIALALLLLVGVGFLYRKGMLTPALEVQVATVQNIYPSQTFTLLNASGYVVAQRKAAVASKVTGRLVFLAVEEGSRVKKGELIARLESEDTKAARDQAQANVVAASHNLDQAKAELKDASLNYTRRKELAAGGYIAQSDFDAAEARYRKAEAAVAAQEATLRASTAGLREAEVMLEYTNIRAPFDAVVLTKNADIGDIVTPIGAAAEAKAAVVTIADMDSLQVEVDVSESNIQQVKVGQPCEIRLDSLPETRFPGKVHMIVPTADRTKASVLVKVAFAEKDPRVLPQMSAKVAFLSRPVAEDERKPLRAVPAATIVSADGQSAVFAVRSDRVEKVPVRLGRQLGDMTEILDGLQVGDRVVTAPLNKVRGGTRVKIREG
ncbi:MAG TPA: efflux RND transporter periplasmic adaptor subunit, partial [Syntrophobacteria bacterium]|nr:efflux RND transporter periplasmic adaptor subunit [Syntrophobacteria bacterium]